MSVHLTKKHKSSRDAKLSIATASLGTKKSRFNQIKVRFDICNNFHQNAIDVNRSLLHFAPLDRSKEISTLQQLQVTMQI